MTYDFSRIWESNVILQSGLLKQRGSFNRRDSV